MSTNESLRDPMTGESRDPEPKSWPGIGAAMIGTLLRSEPDPIRFEPYDVIREGRKLYRDAILSSRDEDASMIAESLAGIISACADRINPVPTIEPADDSR